MTSHNHYLLLQEAWQVRPGGAPTSQVLPRRWLYTPVAASSTRVSLSSFTASVEPSEVTASPGRRTPAATNAATLSANHSRASPFRFCSLKAGDLPGLHMPSGHGSLSGLPLLPITDEEKQRG